MNKPQSRLLVIALVVLVLLNIGTLATLWMHHPHGDFPPHDHDMHHGPPHGSDPGDFIADHLHFSDQQREQFEKMRDAHQDSVEKIEDENRHLRKKFFDLLKSDNLNLAQADSLATAIGNNQKGIELAMFQHFNSLKSICNDEQKKKFNDMLDDLMHMMKPPPPPPHEF